ncbi:MAG: hypothetical protein WAZ19_14530 [Anaerolineae bacterium]
MAELNLTKRMTNFVDDTTHTMFVMPQRMLDASRGAFGTTREEAEQLIARGEDLFSKLVERGQDIEFVQNSRLNGVRKEWSQRGMEQLHVAEEQIEQQIQHVLRMLHIPSSEDIKRLDGELDRIAKKLDAHLLERELANLPIENYKAMNVKDVTARLESLTMDELKAVQQFEMAHHNRKTIMREIEQRMEAMLA